MHDTTYLRSNCQVRSPENDSQFRGILTDGELSELLIENKIGYIFFYHQLSLILIQLVPPLVMRLL